MTYSKTDKLILFCEESIDGDFRCGISSNSDLNIDIDMRGHGRTKEESIKDFKKNIFEFAEEVNRIQGRLMSCIYEIGDYGV